MKTRKEYIADAAAALENAGAYDGQYNPLNESMRAVALLLLADRCEPRPDPVKVRITCSCPEGRPGHDWSPKCESIADIMRRALGADK